MSQLHQGQWITFKRQQRFKNFKIMALKDYMTGHHHIILRSQSNLIYFAHFLIDVTVIEPSLAVRLTLREYGEQRKERRLSSQLWMLWRLLGRTCNYRTAWRCLKALRLLWIAKLMSGPRWNNHIVDIYEQMLFITNVVSIDKPINNHGSELPIGLYFIFFVHGFQPASHESHFLVSSKN